MNRAAWNKTRFTRADVHGSSLDGKGNHTFHSVDAFIVMLVRMWQRHLGSYRNHEFKHGNGTVGVGRFEQEFDSDLPDLDGSFFHMGNVSLSLFRRRFVL